MGDKDQQAKSAEACRITAGVDLSGVEGVKLAPELLVADYRAAMAITDKLAGQRLGEYMLLSWYDRERDFEAPQHSSECHQYSALPGYVDYGLSHGASLMVGI